MPLKIICAGLYEHLDVNNIKFNLFMQLKYN